MQAMSTLSPEHFHSKNTVQLARFLVGKALVVTSQEGISSRFRITETEAYDGPDDLACHASKGRTKRTEIMFGPAGYWYVYLIYGIHEMLNLVTGPEEYPAAILIRGVEGIPGPGRLTKKLGIDRKLNGQAATPENGLHLEDAPAVPDYQVQCTARIGVDYAGPDWAQRPYRFVLKSGHKKAFA